MLIKVEDDRTGTDPQALRRAFNDHLHYSQGRALGHATAYDRFFALALTVRDRLVNRWAQTVEAYAKADPKRVYYLSAEFLLGRLLGSNLMALGLYDEMRKVLADLGLELSDLLEQEPDAGLGNGGLGRLAACFLDSMATLGIAGYGYGIRYEFGIFDQEIVNGQQVEHPDQWLQFGTPWEIVRPEYQVAVHFGGRVIDEIGPDGKWRPRWVDTRDVIGVPYDWPIAGYRTPTVNTLRLWRARATHDFDLRVFNAGDYMRAVEDKNNSEIISKVLYPNDQSDAGRELRLKQQYFFVACAISDIVRRWLRGHDSFDGFAQKNAIQLNDTHPAIAVAELMRILIDLIRMEWEPAWEITRATFAYTNHTLLPEALERWPVSLFERLLPRHLQIIYEINKRFLGEMTARWPNDPDRVRRMSMIEEGNDRKVRMAHLAVVGSHAVNGVAALHTQLLKRLVLKDFAEMWPERFSNKTNGVTPRRWLLQCNPRLAQLITDVIGSRWITDLDELERIAPLSDDAAFVDKIRAVKAANKIDFAAWLKRTLRVDVDPQALFDVQVKRIHEYKRQLLLGLHVVRLYLDLKRNPDAAIVPRIVLVGGKAAPGYHMAKLIIRLLCGIGHVVNQDPDIKGRLKLIFLPNYRVSLAEKIFPAADLSEQISTAGTEASGTGNMKFALNGALTIGTLDGANIEIREVVGADNFFLFGLDADGVLARRAAGYHPRRIYEEDARVREVIDAIALGTFSPADPGLFRPITDALVSYDPYFLLADFASYVAVQEDVARAFTQPADWHRRAVLNISKMGRFSSDRTIREYAREIWKAEPVRFTLRPYESP
jgi:starch phosphorylase